MHISEFGALKAPLSHVLIPASFMFLKCGKETPALPLPGISLLAIHADDLEVVSVGFGFIVRKGR